MVLGTEFSVQSAKDPSELYVNINMKYRRDKLAHAI
jgi:hypothetical protein